MITVQQTPRKQSPPTIERQQIPLPEVSVNPHIETPVEQSANQHFYNHESMQNGNENIFFQYNRQKRIFMLFFFILRRNKFQSSSHSC